MKRSTLFVLGVLLLIVAGLGGMQMLALRARLDVLEARMNAPPDSAGSGGEPSSATRVEGELNQRLARLEHSMPRADRATNESARGRSAAADAHHGAVRRFMDTTLPDKDRLAALHQLNKQKLLSDEAVQSALAWLGSTKDPAQRRAILQQLDGATNAILRQPLLELASGGDTKVREEAVQNLRRFAADPEVEKRLWELVQTDPDPKIRTQAEESLRKGPMTPERASSLQQRLADPQAGLDERLTALQALRRGGLDVSDAAAALAQAAQNSPDVVARANIFHALDGVQDPRLLPPLLGGLQDPSPDVRREAAEALSGFASNPDIRKWLQYVAESDADNRVRREAFQSLKKLPAVPQ